MNWEVRETDDFNHPYKDFKEETANIKKRSSEMSDIQNEKSLLKDEVSIHQENKQKEDEKICKQCQIQNIKLPFNYFFFLSLINAALLSMFFLRYYDYQKLSKDVEVAILFTERYIDKIIDLHIKLIDKILDVYDRVYDYIIKKLC